MPRRWTENTDAAHLIEQYLTLPVFERLQKRDSDISDSFEQTSHRKVIYFVFSFLIFPRYSAAPLYEQNLALS